MLVRAMVLSVVLTGSIAPAFCGFYVSSAGGQLFNDATMVSLMREGTRTVLAMQNNYRGPPEDFAMVVPVPVVLQKQNVRTLQKSAFERLDALTAPRLVEQYTDLHPCPMKSWAGPRSLDSEGGGAVDRELKVKVEAQFSVDEYDIVILSAEDALGLEIWLKEHRYRIPDGAEPLLRPYVQSGSKFFVARVDAKKVKFVTVDGQKQAALSPLRFFYDSEKFELPIRLGLINSSGSQDLIVTVIARDRYELANRENVTIPTNLDVRAATRGVFGSFYKALVDREFEAHPTAAITEFAWKGALPPPQTMVESGIYGVTCDPCPPPHPADDPLARNLGADVIGGLKTDAQVAKFAKEVTVTRLHLRSSRGGKTDDLVFQRAAPLRGGIPEAKTVSGGESNRFQGRYVIWRKGSACYAGAPGGMVGAVGGIAAVAAPPRPLSKPLEEYLLTAVPELKLTPVTPSGSGAPSR